MSHGLLKWSEVNNLHGFSKFYEEFCKWVRSNKELLNFLIQLSKKEAGKRNGSDELQMQYSLEEAAVSVFINGKICEIELYPGEDNKFIELLHNTYQSSLARLLEVDNISRKYVNATLLAA